MKERISERRNPLKELQLRVQSAAQENGTPLSVSDQLLLMKAQTMAPTVNFLLPLAVWTQQQ